MHNNISQSLLSITNQCRYSILNHTYKIGRMEYENELLNQHPICLHHTQYPLSVPLGWVGMCSTLCLPSLMMQWSCGVLDIFHTTISPNVFKLRVRGLFIIHLVWHIASSTPSYRNPKPSLLLAHMHHYGRVEYIVENLFGPYLSSLGIVSPQSTSKSMKHLDPYWPSILKSLNKNNFDLQKPQGSKP